MVIDCIRTLEQIGNYDLLSFAWAVAGFDHSFDFSLVSSRNVNDSVSEPL